MASAKNAMAAARRNAFAARPRPPFLLQRRRCAVNRRQSNFQLLKLSVGRVSQPSASLSSPVRFATGEKSRGSSTSSSSFEARSSSSFASAWSLSWRLVRRRWPDGSAASAVRSSLHSAEVFLTSRLRPHESLVRGLSGASPSLHDRLW